MIVDDDFTSNSELCAALQLFRQGGTLSDLSTGSEPDYGDESDIGAMGRSLGEGVTKVSSS